MLSNVVSTTLTLDTGNHFPEPPRHVTMKSEEISEPEHTETILCPRCKSHQVAIVIHSKPFWSYVHVCGVCSYCITESEWEKLTP